MSRTYLDILDLGEKYKLLVGGSVKIDLSMGNIRVWVFAWRYWLKSWLGRLGGFVQLAYGQRAVRVFVLASYVLTFFIALPIWNPQQAKAAIIAHVNSASANTGGSAATSLLINKPTSTVIGQVMIAAIATDAGGTFTPPSGWVQAQTVSNTVVLTAWYKVAGGSEPADYTFSWTNSVKAAGGISTYSGVNTAHILDFRGATNTGSGTALTATGLTTVHDDAMLLGIFGGRQAGAGVTFTPGTSLVDNVDTSATTANTASVEMAELNQTTAGASGNKTSTASSSITWGSFLIALRPAGATQMMLFWDGGAAPTGWSIVSAFDGQYPRGNTVSNFGEADESTEGNHTPTATVTINATAGNNFDIGASSNLSATGHSHPNMTVSQTAATNTDDFAYCTLKLIRYNSGIPNVIPSGAIAMFDGTPGVPATGWTRFSAQDSKMIKISATAGTCAGTDTHTHTLTYSSLGAASATAARNLIGTSSGSVVAHTHTAPGATPSTSDTCSSTGCLPAHVQPLMAKASSDTTTIPIGMISMFDGDPGLSWLNLSDAGQSFNSQFLRPNTCGAAAPYTSCFNGTSAGAATHTHSNVISAATGAAAGGAGLTSDTVVDGIPVSNHTHTLRATFDAAENDPDYFNVVIAEKISFTLSNYRWYVDPDPAGNDNTVSDPWSSQDIPQNQAITVTPVAKDAPPSGRELRLRLNMTVGGRDLTGLDVQFKLQYRLNTDMSCLNGTWTDVGAGGSGEIWRYATSNITDGGLLTGTAALSSNVNEQYIKSASAGTNPNGATVGQTIEYDFHIQHNGAASATQYSFRVIETTGIFLSVYSQCPTLQTLAGPGDQLRHGDVFVGGSDQGFTWAD